MHLDCNFLSLELITFYQTARITTRKRKREMSHFVHVDKIDDWISINDGNSDFFLIKASPHGFLVCDVSKISCWRKLEN